MHKIKIDLQRVMRVSQINAENRTILANPSIQKHCLKN